jgi:hypothetical protein
MVVPTATANDALPSQGQGRTKISRLGFPNDCEAIMSGWVERWRNRHRELANGVDAELVQANRRRFRVAFALIGLAFVVGLLDARLHLPHVLDVVLRCAAAVAGVVGIVMAKWAQQEDTFLKRPESEGPPTIFKE